MIANKICARISASMNFSMTSDELVNNYKQFFESYCKSVGLKYTPLNDGGLMFAIIHGLIKANVEYFSNGTSIGLKEVDVGMRLQMHHTSMSVFNVVVLGVNKVNTTTDMTKSTNCVLAQSIKGAIAQSSVADGISFLDSDLVAKSDKIIVRSVNVDYSAFGQKMYAHKVDGLSDAVVKSIVDLLLNAMRSVEINGVYEALDSDGISIESMDTLFDDTDQDYIIVNGSGRFPKIGIKNKNTQSKLTLLKCDSNCGGIALEGVEIVKNFSSHTPRALIDKSGLCVSPNGTPLDIDLSQSTLATEMKISNASATTESPVHLKVLGFDHRCRVNLDKCMPDAKRPSIESVKPTTLYGLSYRLINRIESEGGWQFNFKLVGDNIDINNFGNTKVDGGSIILDDIGSVSQQNRVATEKNGIPVLKRPILIKSSDVVEFSKKKLTNPFGRDLIVIDRLYFEKMFENNALFIRKNPFDVIVLFSSIRKGGKTNGYLLSYEMIVGFKNLYYLIGIPKFNETDSTTPNTRTYPLFEKSLESGVFTKIIERKLGDTYGVITNGIRNFITPQNLADFGAKL